MGSENMDEVIKKHLEYFKSVDKGVTTLAWLVGGLLAVELAVVAYAILYF